MDPTELRRLLKEATPLPWDVDDGATEVSAGPLGIFAAEDSDAICYLSESALDSKGLRGPEQDAANAALMVAAVNALPELLDAAEKRVKRVEEEREQCARVADRFMNDTPGPHIARNIADIIRARTSRPPSIAATEAPTMTREQIKACLRIGEAEAAANAEYRTGRYHPEDGGPAMERLRKARAEKVATFPALPVDPAAGERMPEHVDCQYMNDHWATGECPRCKLEIALGWRTDRAGGRTAEEHLRLRGFADKAEAEQLRADLASARATLQETERSHFALEEMRTSLMADRDSARAERDGALGQRARLREALTDALELIDHAEPNTHNPWCNGVHADNGACEGSHMAGVLIERLRAALSEPSPGWVVMPSEKAAGIEKAMAERVRSGCNDTCSSVLGPYPCSCGGEALASALDSFRALSPVVPGVTK